MEAHFKRLKMSVPTKEEIIKSFGIPEVKKRYDRLGRRIEKKNINYVRGSKPIGASVSTAEVRRVRSALYKGR